MAIRRAIEHIAGQGNTISTGTLDFITFSPPNGSAGGLFLTCTGKSSAATPDICKRAILGAWKKSNAGVLTIAGLSNVQSFTDLTLLATDATIVVVGGSLTARATGGLLGTDLEWYGDMWISVN